MKSSAPAIFLDRDGVLIHEVNYLSNLTQIRIYDDVPQGLIRLRQAGYHLIVVTNQSGVARGLFTEDFVWEAFNHINQLLNPFSIQLDGMYYCPHHVHGNPPWNRECDCRKPAPGMVEQAQKDFPIVMDQSYMIGDKLCDIELAVNAKVKGIQLKTGHGIQEVSKVQSKYPGTPVCTNFTAAVDLILDNQA